MTANTTTRKFYVCAPDAGCSNYSDTLHFFEEWGIEPAPGHDAGGHYFAISVPEDWPEERASEFEAALAARTRKLTFEEQASAFAGEIFLNSGKMVFDQFPDDRRLAGRLLLRALSLVGGLAKQLKVVESAP